jgi:ABC-2 type transport system permease protein
LKAVDIALKDLISALRSTMGLLFMFGIPLLVTGMFYLMFGSMASGGEFDLPRTKVVIANLDQHGPRLRAGRGSISDDLQANTLSELVVEVLQDDEMANLVEVSLAADAAAARSAVDGGQAQVAIIIPEGFSRQYADLYGESTIQFYQDPTLTLGPGIIESILNQFMDGLSGAKIAVKLAMEQAGETDNRFVGQVVEGYLAASPGRGEGTAQELLEVQSPGAKPENENQLAGIIGPIMGGMMVFYAFYTATATAQSILREEEQRTLQRLFTTPTPQSTILSGKFLAVFLTVIVQIAALLVFAQLVFGIEWGEAISVTLFAVGTVFLAASFGIFINSISKNTKQGGIIFGGVLTFSGMIGMVSIFAMNSPSAARLGNSVSLLVPQGWAVRGLLQTMGGQPVFEVLKTMVVMLAWSAVLFVVGVWRFKKRYA